MKPILLLSIAAMAVAGCAGPKPAPPEKPKEKPTAEAPRLVGRIASIPANKKFVLIQSYEKWNIAAGTILTTRGPDDRNANLLATGESLGQFAAADLQSGQLEVGDAVYSRHVPAPPEEAPEPSVMEPSPELPEMPQETESGDILKNN